jgi:hypothetical protein
MKTREKLRPKQRDLLRWTTPHHHVNSGDADRSACAPQSSAVLHCCLSLYVFHAPKMQANGSRRLIGAHAAIQEAQELAVRGR